MSEQGEVNAAVVRGRITFLFGETCLHCGTVVYGNPDVVSTTKGVGCLPVPGSEQMQRLSAIKSKKPAGDRQESAVAIVAKRRRETYGHDEGPNPVQGRALCSSQSALKPYG